MGKTKDWKKLARKEVKKKSFSYFSLENKKDANAIINSFQLDLMKTF